MLPATKKAVSNPASFYRQLVTAPPRTSINTGLTPARHATMMKVWGAPGKKTTDCSQPTNPKVLNNLKLLTITPALRATGFAPFLKLVDEALEEAAIAHPNLYPLITTAGCICCRLVRNSDTYFSNHSWGTAIDLKIAGILSPQGATKIPQGLLTLYPYFYKRKLFWAQGYKGLTDPMHFEASNELILEWDKAGII